MTLKTLFFLIIIHAFNFILKYKLAKCQTALKPPQARLEYNGAEIIPFQEMRPEYQTFRYGFPKYWSLEKFMLRYDLKGGSCDLCYDSKSYKFRYDMSENINNSKKFYHCNDIGEFFKNCEKLNTFPEEDKSIFIWFVRCHDRIFREQYKESCPDPCEKRPCENKNYIDQPNKRKCQLVSPGLYETDYACHCSSFAVWSQQNLNCYLRNPCKNISSCGSEKKSEGCIYDNRGQYFCKCKISFMGEQCEEPRNACKENYNRFFRAGDKTCQPTGKCIPIMGTNRYYCQCNIGYMDDKRTNYPDCSYPVDPCAHVLCVRGFCHVLYEQIVSINSTTAITAETQQKAHKTICICDDGWEGEVCNRKMATWLPWMPWTRCEPDCGNNMQRKRNRTCSQAIEKCIANKTNELAQEQIEKCASILCKSNMTIYVQVGSSALNETWSYWSSCRGDCNDAKQARFRKCPNTTNNCRKGDIEHEFIKCFPENCRLIYLWVVLITFGVVLILTLIVCLLFKKRKSKYEIIIDMYKFKKKNPKFEFEKAVSNVINKDKAKISNQMTKKKSNLLPNNVIYEKKEKTAVNNQEKYDVYQVNSEQEETEPLVDELSKYWQQYNVK